MRGKMKALTLWQPWATLIALGLKKYETRSWATDYRGPLVIHAAQRKMTTLELGLLTAINKYPSAVIQLPKPEDFPLGAIVAVCELTDCIPSEEFTPDGLEKLVGNFGYGRFAWKLDKVHPLDVPNVRGMQGLWNVQNPKDFGISGASA